MPVTVPAARFRSLRPVARPLDRLSRAEVEVLVDVQDGESSQFPMAAMSRSGTFTAEL